MIAVDYQLRNRRLPVNESKNDERAAAILEAINSDISRNKALTLEVQIDENASTAVAFRELMTRSTALREYVNSLVH